MGAAELDRAVDVGTLYGSDAEVAAAFTVNFSAWGSNCGRMSRALKAQYGFSAEAVAFFDLFANLPAADDSIFATIQDDQDAVSRPL